MNCKFCGKDISFYTPISRQRTWLDNGFCSSDCFSLAERDRKWVETQLDTFKIFYSSLNNEQIKLFKKLWNVDAFEELSEEINKVVFPFNGTH